MKFQKGQFCEIVTSDGDSTIGYVDGRPAEWDGNAEDLQAGDYYLLKNEGSTFGVNVQDEFQVVNSRWVDIDGNVFWPESEG